MSVSCLLSIPRWGANPGSINFVFSSSERIAGLQPRALPCALSIQYQFLSTRQSSSLVVIRSGPRSIISGVTPGDPPRIHAAQERRLTTQCAYRATAGNFLESPTVVSWDCHLLALRPLHERDEISCGQSGSTLCVEGFALRWDEATSVLPRRSLASF